MKSLNMLKWLTPGLLSLSLVAGCGGGRGKDPIAPLTDAVINGVVEVDDDAAAREASAARPRLPVANARVDFFVAGEGEPLASTFSDAQGRFTIPARKGVRGRLSMSKDNRMLSALVVIPDVQSSAVTQNLNLESTVVELAMRNQSTLSHDLKALEEQVRIGQASALLAEVKSAFRENRLPSAGNPVLNTSATELLNGETSANQDCLVGQEWCLSFGPLSASANTYTTPLLLRRVRTGNNSGDTSSATVGGGEMVIRLPGDTTLQLVKGEGSGKSAILIKQGPPSATGEIKLVFLTPATNGFAEAARVGTLTLTATRSLTDADRVVQVSQRLFGVLNEQRGSASTRNASKENL